MLAGYETTSTCLAYATYVLAKYADEQEKLYEEITQYFNTDSNVNLKLNENSLINNLKFFNVFRLNQTRTMFTSWLI